MPGYSSCLKKRSFDIMRAGTGMHGDTIMPHIAPRAAVGAGRMRRFSHTPVGFKIARFLVDIERRHIAAIFDA